MHSRSSAITVRAKIRNPLYPEKNLKGNLAMENQEYRTLGIYLHIPFCKRKCAYCDFYSVETDKNEGMMKPYTKAAIHHLQTVSERTTQYNIDTIYIGGGTPTALDPKCLLKLVKEISNSFYLTENPEFTVEMNPGTADLKLLKQLRKYGVNRLSIGAQSANNEELAALSRIHTVKDMSAAFRLAREADFQNINIDLMYGIPGQTTESFRETLQFVISMKPEHISLYGLKIEEGTPFDRQKETLVLPDEETEYNMYTEAISLLSEHGWEQYEISNFARKGYQCRHNLKYWNCEEYIGCGPGSHSCFGGTRYSIQRSLPLYLKALSEKSKTIPSYILDENYTVNETERENEYIMLRMRLSEGLDSEEYLALFGKDFDETYGAKLEEYISGGFVTHTGSKYAFTVKGMYVSNYILSSILSFSERMQKGFCETF